MNTEKVIKGKRLRRRKKRYFFFAGYQKALDRIKHKLAEVTEKTGVLELERRLIINLYWRQHAAVRRDGEVSRVVVVESGVRQGCVISPMVFNLYSELMMNKALENEEGIKFNGVSVTDLRYSDDAMSVADKRKKMQKMVDRLNGTCVEWKSMLKRLK